MTAMSLNRKTKIILPLLSSFCCFSCTVLYKIKTPFVDLYEKNVVWSDEEGKIEITVQGPRQDRGFAKLFIAGEEIKARAEFCNTNWTGVGISLETETSVLSVSDGVQYSYHGYWLEFKKTEGNDSATFEIPKGLVESGDPYFASIESITLKKRALAEENFDAKYCVNGRWWTKDQNMEIYNLDETPFTGKAMWRYGSENLELFYLEDHGFKIIEGEETIGEGKYSTSLDHVTFDFDFSGSETFGESVSLYWCWTFYKGSSK